MSVGAGHSASTKPLARGSRWWRLEPSVARRTLAVAVSALAVTAVLPTVAYGQAMPPVAPGGPSPSDPSPPAGPPAAEPPPVAAGPQGPSVSKPAVRIGQPVDDGVLKVARVAGDEAGKPDRWEIEYDAWFCNPTSLTYTVTSVKVEHLSGGTVIRTLTPQPRGDTQIKPGDPEPGYVQVRDQGQFDFPLPSHARITFTLQADTNTTEVVSETYALAEHVNPGPLGGYFPPFRQSDLPAGSYWSQGRHAESNFQRFAYDLGVSRWTGKAWTSRKEGFALDSKKKEAFGSFGVKLYAVADGEIIGCNRGADDRDAGEAKGNVPGGNLIWLRTGDETILYAHLQKNTIPFALCPFSDDKEHKLADPNGTGPDDAKYTVRAGQYLGRAGSSGSSLSGPHLHIHSFRGLPRIWGGSETGIDADSRPMRFVNVRAQARLDNSDADASKWRDHDRAATFAYNTIIQGDPCAHAGPRGLETVRLQVRASCFGELFNTMVYRDRRPVHIDVTEGPGAKTSWSSVWRRTGGVPWLLYMGLSRAGVDAKVAEWDDKGFRILEAESYREGGAIRYSLILVKQPGPPQFLAGPQTQAAFQSTFNAQKAAGFRPVSLSVTRLAASSRYSGLFERAAVGSFSARTELPLAGYKATFDAQNEAGRRMAFVEGHAPANIAGIWYSALQGGYVASGALTRGQLRKAIADNRKAGRFTRALSGWYSGGKFRYLGLWWSRPDTSITAGPAGTTASTVAEFTHASSDPLAQLECSLDGGAYQACGSTQAYSGLAAGPHTLKVRSRSRDGVVDGSPATRSWTVL
ncbi:MAG: hypothetical protein M3217_11115 [Actinomycetota bacterium]|nr:hypothetical protein [Actinomycetota bacterium]